MIVVHVSKCPERLRGDLTKWLYPIGTGLYVGNVNVRIREYLWSRILENVADGSAVMAYDAKTESGLEMRLHNAGFVMRSYDGLQLPFVRKVLERAVDVDPAASGVIGHIPWRMRKRRRAVQSGDSVIRRLAFVDIETTGLDMSRDRIIEVGVLCADGDRIIAEWSSLVKADVRVSLKISALTGISDKMLESDGIDIEEALGVFVRLIDGRNVICYNKKSDISFLDRDLLRSGKSTIGGMCEVYDALDVVKKYFCERDGPKSLKLQDVAAWFGIDATGSHRALRDCQVLRQVWIKVNENQDVDD